MHGQRSRKGCSSGSQKNQWIQSDPDRVRDCLPQENVKLDCPYQRPAECENFRGNARNSPRQPIRPDPTSFQGQGEILDLRQRVASLEKTIAAMSHERAKTNVALEDLRRALDRLQSARPGWTAAAAPDVEAHLTRLDDRLDAVCERLTVLERRCRALEDGEK